MNVRGWFVAGLVALGCQEPNAPRLVASTTVTPAAFRAGDTVTVRMVFTNLGSANATIFPGCLPMFEVRDANGTVVRAAHQACLMIYNPTPLAPGDSVVAERRWFGDVDLVTWKDRTYLEPGAYSVGPASGVTGAFVPITIIQ